MKAILLSSLLLCACAAVKKDQHRSAEQHRKDSAGTTQNEYSRLAETTTTGTTPGTTKPDSVGFTRYTANDDTSSWSQTVRSGALDVEVNSTPRKDSTGKAIGRETTVKAKKFPEEVPVPVTTHTVVKEEGSAKQESKVFQVDSKKTVDKGKEITRASAWFSIAAGIVAVLLFAWLIYSLYKRFTSVKRK